MIIKIGRVEHGIDWWIKDGVESVEVLSIEEVSQCELSNIAAGDFDAMFLDHFYSRDDFIIEENSPSKIVKKGYTENKDMRYRIIVCSLRNGNEHYSIIYDTIAYLCDDSGKTIDTFRV